MSDLYPLERSARMCFRERRLYQISRLKEEIDYLERQLADLQKEVDEMGEELGY